MSAANVVPRIGKPAPHFECEAVVGDDFAKVSLTDYKGARGPGGAWGATFRVPDASEPSTARFPPGKYLVVLFYPLDFTFVCPTEICAFNDAVARFRAQNCEV